jgi:hypothetical protein
MMPDLKEQIANAIRSSCAGDRYDADCAVLGAEDAAEEILALPAIAESLRATWIPILDLPGASRDEIIVLLADGTVRTAARGLGTILLGPYGESARADNWPTRWRPLPSPEAS